MKERDAIMRKRAEDRLEKSRQRAEAAEKLRQEEEERQEQAKLRRIEQAKKSGNVDESGNPRAETWEERLEREKQEREERKLKHKAAILAQRVPLTASLEESITVFKDSKGKYAPEPPKIKVEPIKATDPEKVRYVRYECVAIQVRFSDSFPIWNYRLLPVLLGMQQS